MHYRECKRRLIPCSNKCGLRIRVCDMQQHIVAECKDRNRDCPFECGASIGPYSDWLLHQRFTCPNRLVECPNSCKIGSVRACQLQVHVSSECTKRIEPCPRGCGEQMPEEDLKLHLVEGEHGPCTHRMLRCRYDMIGKVLHCEASEALFRDSSMPIEVKTFEAPAHESTALSTTDIGEELGALRRTHICTVVVTGFDVKAGVVMARVEGHGPVRFALAEVRYMETHDSAYSCGWFAAHERSGHEQLDCTMRTSICRLGCGASMTFEQVLRHEQHACPVRELQCDKCSEHMLAKDLWPHQANECQFRVTKCACGMDVVLKRMDSHIQHECGQTLVFCPANCGLKTARQHLEHHMHSTCARRQISCPNSCGDTIWLGDTSSHALVCRFAMFPCKHGCGMELANKDVEKHSSV